MSTSVPRWAYGWLALIITIAALFRFVALDYAPSGGHGDVAWIGINALDWVDNGIWPFYVRELYAPEPFPVYLTGLLIPFAGISYLPQRIITATMGVLFVGLLFPATWSLMADRSITFRANASLLAALAGASSLHIIALNRLGMESPPFLTVLTLLVWLTARAWNRNRPVDWILAGATLALAQYVFLAARLLPIVLVLWIAHSWFFKRSQLRQCWRGWLIMAFGSFLLTLPALFLFVTTPEAFSARADAGTAQTGGWIWEYDTSGFGGTLNLIAQKIGLTLLAFGIRWDGPYNVMNQPMLGPLFFVGLIAAVPKGIRHFHNYGYAWPLLAIPVMLVTDLISGAVLEIHALHQMGVLPFVMILSGIGLAYGLEFVRNHLNISQYMVVAITGLVGLLPTILGLNTYLRVAIPAQYADPDSSWDRAQTDVDMGRYLVAHRDEAFLLPVSEYTRSDVAWVLAEGFRYRRSAVNTDGLLDNSDVPQQLNIMLPTAPERPRHDGFPSHVDPRLWVLLHNDQVLLLPPFEDSQVEAILDHTATVAPEELVDRSDTVIANVYKNVELSQIFATRAIIDYPLNATFNSEIQLLGYTLPSQDLKPGDITFITLFWQPLVPVQEDYEIFVQLWNDEQQSIGGAHDFPWGGMYRTRIWQQDEVVMTHHWVQIPDDLQIGRYSLIAGLFRLLHNENVPVIGPDADIENHLVRAPALRYPPPPPAVSGSPVTESIQFGDFFAISGLNFSVADRELASAPWMLSPGDILQAEVFWDVLKRPDRDYSMFLHLVNSLDQPPVAQADLTMGSGFSTGVWHAGERYYDNINLELPETLEPGTYDLLLGTYFWQTGERLPGFYGENPVADNRIKVGEIVITDQ